METTSDRFEFTIGAKDCLTARLSLERNSSGVVADFYIEILAPEGGFSLNLTEWDALKDAVNQMFLLGQGMVGRE